VATETITHAPTRKRERLDPSVFRLPVERIREGYYSDVYFNRTVEVLNADSRHPQVLMQVFQKNQAVVGGMDEAIAIVKLCSEDFSQLRVHALYDGDEAAPWETTMTIEGDYSLFARLETVYLGVLSRRTKVATNVRRVVEAANGKQIIYNDHPLYTFTADTAAGQTNGQGVGRKGFVATTDLAKTTATAVQSTPTAPTSTGSLIMKTASATVGGKAVTILTTVQGMTLYYFTPDTITKAACTGSCAETWPPLLFANSGAPTAAGRPAPAARAAGCRTRRRS